MASRVGPNDPCPCGSGKKFKRCCRGAGVEVIEQRRLKHQRRRFRTVLLITLAALGIVVSLVFLIKSGVEDRDASARLAFTARPGYPQPPGPAPPGKVWSVEHGHWHNAPLPLPSGQVPLPQPEGPAPPGKVWSPEHGHWHDVQ